MSTDLSLIAVNGYVLLVPTYPAESYSLFRPYLPPGVKWEKYRGGELYNQVWARVVGHEPLTFRVGPRHCHIFESFLPVITNLCVYSFARIEKM